MTTLDLSSLKKAVKSLNASIKVAQSESEIKNFSQDAKDTIRAGVIQNFEFTYELCWKFMKRQLENELGSAYIDGVARKELFRIAAENHLIRNTGNWMEYHDKRNETAHTYDKETAEEVFESAIGFVKDAEELLLNLEKRNA